MHSRAQSCKSLYFDNSERTPLDQPYSPNLKLPFCDSPLTSHCVINFACNAHLLYTSLNWLHVNTYILVSQAKPSYDKVKKGSGQTANRSCCRGMHDVMQLL